MSNKYGFDFLRSEHTLNAEGQPKTAAHDATIPPALSAVPSGPIPMNAEHKSDLEKQFDILAFLQAHRGSGLLAPNVIYKATGIDLDLESNEAVVQNLQKNPKVRVELVPDPENPALMVATYAYQAKYSSVRDRASLLAQINRMPYGIPMHDLLDSYATVQEDLQGLLTAGDVIAVYNSEDRDKILFPRGEAFLVELDGSVTLPSTNTAEPAVVSNDESSSNKSNGDSHDREHNDKDDTDGNREGAKADAIHSSSAANEKVEGGSPTNGGGATKQEVKQETNSKEVKIESQQKRHYIAETDMDPRTQIRRGEAVQVGGQWFRVSSAVKEGPLSEQPARAQAPLSVVSLDDLSKRNEIDGYIRPFNATKLPLDAPLTETAQGNLQAAKQAHERLLKLSHGRTGGVAGQLLGSHAHASNPTTLAKSSSMRKRPNTKMSHPAVPSNPKAHHPPHHLPKDSLAQAAADPALALYSHARRHGCTRDVRDMYLATREVVPESDHDLQQLLLQHKLLEPGELMRRPRLARTGANFDNDGKPKKRRYYERKNQRMTNTHLEGTEIGAVLARAAEKQKQGKSVGDGGM